MSDIEERRRDLSWKVLDTEEILDERPWFAIDRQKVELPDGRVIEDYHFINLPEYVVMAAYTREGSLVMLRQYKHGYGRMAMALPGGLLDEGESPLEAAKRELIEETGYSSDEWVSLGSFVPHSNYGCGKAHFFLAVDSVQTAEPDAGDLEELEVVIMKIDEVMQSIRTNNTVSLSTTCAIMLAQDRRQAGGEA